MVKPFIYTANPGRVIFGEGTRARLADEVARLGLKRVLILSAPTQQAEAQTVKKMLGDRAADLFLGAATHTPIVVTEKVMDLVQQLDVGGIVAIGGGTTIGLGKAIALRTDLPQIVIPTTYAGSEMTPILGETVDGMKTTQTSAKILPEVVIYDVELTVTLPVAQSVTSGVNAIAHAVEALYARDRNPVTSLMASEGIAVLTKALPRIALDPGDISARGSALYGAWLCGICLGTVGMALHHKLCHVLGGLFALPHSETHTVILPHALAYNAQSSGESMVKLEEILGADPAETLFELAGQLGAKRALRDLGMPESGIDEAAARALTNPYWNPRPLELASVRELIARAWAGDPPKWEHHGAI